MKRVFNAIIFLVLVACLLYVGWKAKLIPNPLDPSGPEPNPTPVAVQRDQLRVAVAQRPEKLLTTSLKRLLEVENLQLELVEYNPETVWLELGSQEIDLVIAPIGEAVQAQGRFENGRFLFFTGQSQGLDQLLVDPKTESAKRVGVFRQAATEFLARQMLPEASVVPAASQLEVEEWLRGGAVDAALIDTSITPPELSKKFKILTTTSAEKPMPTVAVLSKDFAENAGKPHYSKRKQVLEAAMKSWAGLVSYLDSQPELLKTTLKKEAEEAGIDVDRLLEGYRYLSPAAGRLSLEEYHQAGFLKRTLDLLVLSGATNLTAPNWEDAVVLPPALSDAVAQGPQRQSSTPVESPTPAVPPVVTPTPDSSPAQTPEPQNTPETTPTPEETALSGSEPSLTASYTYPDSNIPNEWPKPLQDFRTGKSFNFPPALTRKQVAVAASDKVWVRDYSEKRPKFTTQTTVTTPVLADQRSFFMASEGQVQAFNSSGKELWSRKVTGTPMAAPRLLDEKLYYLVSHNGEGEVLCLDAVDGEQLWAVSLSSTPLCTPVFGQGNQGLIVISTESGELKALYLRNGRTAWTLKLKSPVYIDPGAGFGELATTEADGTVRLRSLSDGKQLWEVNLGTSLIAPPTITSNGVLVPSKDTYLYSLDRKNGSISWKTRLSHPLSQPAVALSQKIAQSDEGGHVHLLKLSDGSLLNTIEVGGGWVSRVSILEDYWAVLDDKGKCKVYKHP